MRRMNLRADSFCIDIASTIARTAATSMGLRTASAEMSCATVLPRRVIRTISPLAARTTSLLRCALASVMFTLPMMVSGPSGYTSSHSYAITRYPKHFHHEIRRQALDGVAPVRLCVDPRQRLRDKLTVHVPSPIPEPREQTLLNAPDRFAIAALRFPSK